MPKRPYEDSDEEKWEKKLKKYQKKLERKRKKRRVLIYSDSDDEILDIAEIQGKQVYVLLNSACFFYQIQPEKLICAFCFESIRDIDQ